MAEPVLLATAKAHLRVPLADTSEDTIIEAYIRAARQWVEEFTGHIISPRNFVDRYEAWGDYLTIYRQPVTAIVSIAYDSATVDQTPFTGFEWSLGYFPARIYPTGTFPSLRSNGYITVTYTAGYASGVPDALIQAVLLMVGHFFSTRSGVSIDSPEEVPLAVRSLCTPYRGAVMA